MKKMRVSFNVTVYVFVFEIVDGQQHTTKSCYTISSIDEPSGELKMMQKMCESVHRTSY